MNKTLTSLQKELWGFPQNNTNVHDRTHFSFSLPIIQNIVSFVYWDIRLPLIK